MTKLNVSEREFENISYYKAIYCHKFFPIIGDCYWILWGLQIDNYESATFMRIFKYVLDLCWSFYEWMVCYNTRLEQFLLFGYTWWLIPSTKSLKKSVIRLLHTILIKWLCIIKWPNYHSHIQSHFMLQDKGIIARNC